MGLFLHSCRNYCKLNPNFHIIYFLQSHIQHCYFVGYLTEQVTSKFPQAKGWQQILKYFLMKNNNKKKSQTPNPLKVLLKHCIMVLNSSNKACPQGISSTNPCCKQGNQPYYCIIKLDYYTGLSISLCTFEL